MRNKIFLILLLLLVLVTGCDEGITINDKNDEKNNAINETIDEEIIQEEKISQEDFVLEIGTLPYKGAVLFIEYNGEADISEKNLFVDIMDSKYITKQKDMPVVIKEVGDEEKLVAIIIDFMYVPGDELNVRMWCDKRVVNFRYTLTFERYYPFLDWMLAEGQYFTLQEGYENFHYHSVSYKKWRWGFHPAWDILIQRNRSAPVYSSTLGYIVYVSMEAVSIYNPYVGAHIQYVHTYIADGLKVGDPVVPGQYISDIVRDDWHIHFAVVRPHHWTYHPQRTSYYGCGKYTRITGNLYTERHLQDPFYWHEPATMGYWNEENMPSGLVEQMKRLFRRDNPGVELPALSPLEWEN